MHNFGNFVTPQISQNESISYVFFSWCTSVGKMNNDMFKSGKNKNSHECIQNPLGRDHVCKRWPPPPLLVLQNLNPMENFKTSILGLTHVDWRRMRRIENNLEYVAYLEFQPSRMVFEGQIEPKLYFGTFSQNRLGKVLS